MSTINKDAEFKASLNLVFNGKGGVGKTVITSHLHEWLRYQNLDHLLLDADDNKSLTRMCPAAVPHALTGKIEAVEDGIKVSRAAVTKEGVESLLHRVLDADIVLADNPANVTAEFSRFFASIQFTEAFEAVGARLNFLLVITSADTVAADEARRLVAAINVGANYVVILNERLGSNFETYHASATHEVLKSLSAPEIRFPAIPARIQQVLDEKRMTLPAYVGCYWELRKTDPKAWFRATVPAQEATTALKTAFLAFNSIAGALLPTAIAAKIQPVDGEKLKSFCIARWQERQGQKN